MSFEDAPWQESLRGDWRSTGPLMPLDAAALQLWRIDIESCPEPLDAYLKRLSRQELDRAARLQAGNVKAQFVIARACLRLLLGVNLSLNPQDVPITLGAYGKPEVIPINNQHLFFNLAHSRSTIVIALSRSGNVGIDLEYIDRKTDIREVASQVFTPQENAQFAGISDERERRLAFFRCWTRKEALAKADGRGLSLPFDTFEVPLFAEARALPIRIEHEPATTYFLSDVVLSPHMAGACAASTRPSRIEMFDFPAAML